MANVVGQGAQSRTRFVFDLHLVSHRRASMPKRAGRASSAITLISSPPLEGEHSPPNVQLADARRLLKLSRRSLADCEHELNQNIRKERLYAELSQTLHAAGQRRRVH